MLWKIETDPALDEFKHSPYHDWSIMGIRWENTGDAYFLIGAGLENRVDFRVCTTLNVFSCLYQFVFRFYFNFPNKFCD